MNDRVRVRASILLARLRSRNWFSDRKRKVDNAVASRILVKLECFGRAQRLLEVVQQKGDETEQLCRELEEARTESRRLTEANKVVLCSLMSLDLLVDRGKPSQFSTACGFANEFGDTRSDTGIFDIDAQKQNTKRHFLYRVGRQAAAALRESQFWTERLRSCSGTCSRAGRSRRGWASAAAAAMLSSSCEASACLRPLVIFILLLCVFVFSIAIRCQQDIGAAPHVAMSDLPCGALQRFEMESTFTSRTCVIIFCSFTLGILALLWMKTCVILELTLHLLNYGATFVGNERAFVAKYSFATKL